MLHLYQAEPSDADVLTEIAKASKAHWGYPEEWLAMWNDELTITPAHIINDYYVKAVDDDQVLGFAAVQCRSDSKTRLNLQQLWVRPSSLNQGIGRLLFDHMLIYCGKVATCTHIEVLSDPNAQGFYEAMGCKVVSDQPSSIPNRTLPLMRRALIATL